jgi:hypothetical protein
MYNGEIYFTLKDGDFLLYTGNGQNIRLEYKPLDGTHFYLNGNIWYPHQLALLVSQHRGDFSVESVKDEKNDNNH